MCACFPSGTVAPTGLVSRSHLRGAFQRLVGWLRVAFGQKRGGGVRRAFSRQIQRQSWCEGQIADESPQPVSGSIFGAGRRASTSFGVHKSACAMYRCLVALSVLTSQWMATALNTQPCVLRSGLLHDAVLPVFYWSEASIGRCFYFEQRYWLQYFGIRDACEYRKRERRSGYITQALEQWNLGVGDVRLPSQEPESFKTVVFSTPLSLAWLLQKFRQFETGRDDAKLQRCRLALHSWCAMALQGFTRCEQRPVLMVQDIMLRVLANGRLDLSALCEHFEGLPQEWERLRFLNATCDISPWPHDDAPRVSDLLFFLEARVHFSPGLPSTHWLRQLSASVLLAMAFGMEVEVGHTLAQESRKPHNLAISLLMGRLQKRQCRKGAVSKLQLLQKVCEVHGSKNTIMDVLTGSKGYIAVCRSVSNGMYVDLSRRTLEGAASLSLSWDAATYGGVSTNIAIAMDCFSENACYLKPGVDQGQQDLKPSFRMAAGSAFGAE